MCPRVSEEYKQEKKHEILRAARRVFIRKGYTRTVMQDIMDEAGCPAEPCMRILIMWSMYL